MTSDILLTIKNSKRLPMIKVDAFRICVSMLYFSSSQIKKHPNVRVLLTFNIGRNDFYFVCQMCANLRTFKGF